MSSHEFHHYKVTHADADVVITGVILTLARTLKPYQNVGCYHSCNKIIFNHDNCQHTTNSTAGVSKSQSATARVADNSVQMIVHGCTRYLLLQHWATYRVIPLTS